MKTSTQLKALIRNLSKDKDIKAEILLRNFMLERLLERISISKYRNQFILKGGMLIAAIVGVDARSTMDMDATINGSEYIQMIEDSTILSRLWDQYRLKNEYASEIEWNDTLESMKRVFNKIQIN